MKLVIVLMLTLCGGCLAGALVSRPATTTVVDTGVELSAGRPGPAGALATEVRGRAATIVVHASRQRDCAQTKFRSFDMYTTTTGDWPALLADLPGLSHVSKTHEQTAFAVVHAACPLEVADLPVVLALPSGATLEGTTAADGHARFTIPDSEPPSGTVVAHVADRELPLRYHMTHEACVEDRRALFAAAAASEPKGRAGRLAALPSSRCDDDDAAWTLVTTAAIEAARSSCSTTRAIDRQLFAHYPALHDAVFATERDIAWCLRTAPPES